MTRAALIMLVAMSLIPAGDAAGKLLSEAGHSPLFVAWSRFLIGALLVLPFFAARGLPLLRDWRIWLRGLLLASGISLIQTALQKAPLGDVFSAFFIGPIFSYLLAGLLLKEPMGRLRSCMIVLGFVGVLFVVRPGANMTPDLLYAVAAGICYGAFLTASRWVSHVGTPGALIFTQLFIGALLLAPFGAARVPELTPEVIFLTLASATFSMLGNLSLLFAYRLAPATTLAPLVYLQLPAAVILGWFVFSDLPDTMTWIGAIIIIAAGITAARTR